MICEKCGKDIHSINVNTFNHDGADSFVNEFIAECEETGAVWFETTTNWVGYEQSEEEMNRTIECPHCHQNPFEDEEIQVYTVVRVVKFSKPQNEELKDIW